MRNWTKEELEAEGLNDFREFLHQVWSFLTLRPELCPPGTQYFATAIQNDIAEVLANGPDRMVIQGFRGVGKSFITAAFVCWILLFDPQAKIMVVSATEPLAVDFADFVQRLLAEMPLLQHLQSVGRDSVMAYNVAGATPDKSPSLKAVGINGQLTGSRADIIIADDIEIPKNSATQIMREKLANLVREFDAVLKPGGRIVYLGTPQCEMSIYRTLEQRGYQSYVWPVLVPAEPEKYHGRLAPFIHKLIAKATKALSIVEPLRFSPEDIAKRRLSYGAAGFQLQFMLDTSLSDLERHPLKLRDLIVTSLDSKMAHLKYVWTQDKDRRHNDLMSIGLEGDFFAGPGFKSDEVADYTDTVMAIDPSGEGSDETAYAVMRQLYGYLFLIDVGGFRDGFGQATLDALAAKCVRHGVKTVLIEKNFGGGMFRNLLQPVITAAVLASTPKGQEPALVGMEDILNTGQKETRIINSLLPLVQSHRIIVDREVFVGDYEEVDRTNSSIYTFSYQFTRLTRDRKSLGHDDRVEAVAIAAKYYADRVTQDAEVVVAQRRESDMMAAVHEFIRNSVESPLANYIVGRAMPETSGDFGRSNRGLR